MTFERFPHDSATRNCNREKHLKICEPVLLVTRWK